MHQGAVNAPKRSFAKRLIALGVAITVGFSTLFAIDLWTNGDRDHEQARLSASNIVASISSEIERNLELYDLSLQAVVDGMKMPEFSQFSPKIRNLVLFDRASTAKDMGSIFVLDQSGTVIVDSRTLTPIAANHVDRDYFKVQELNPIAGLYVSRPWQDFNGEYVIAISRRLSNADGAFSGVVVGTLRLSYIANLFGKIQRGNGDALTLIREDGSFVMRAPFSADLMGRSFAGSPIFQRLVSYPSGAFDYTAQIDGVKRLYAFQRVGEHPLVLSYGVSLDSIYAGWWRNVWLKGPVILALAVINMALVAFLAFALRRRSEAEHRISIMATTDSLTGLSNRRRLDELFDLEWRRAMRAQGPIALLMIDADNFKAYNDQFGHQSGDSALVAIANCIAGTTRRATDVSARYGGEEFAVLLPGMSITSAFDLAEKIRHSLLALRADQQGRADSTPTVSIGVASMIPREGLHPKDLIKAADAALYEAKRKGRDRIEATIRIVDLRIPAAAA